MLRFTILEGKLVIDPSILMIKEFTDILEYGQSKKDPKLANDMLLYVFFCCDLTGNNPMSDIDYRLKPGQAASRVFHKPDIEHLSKKESALIDAAIDAYNFLNETSLERAGLAYDQKIDEIRSLLERLTPEVHASCKFHACDFCTDINPDGINQVQEIEKYVSNAADLEKFAKLLGDMATYKLKAMETAKKIENTGRVRSGKGSSMIERGVFLRDDK